MATKSPRSKKVERRTSFSPLALVPLGVAVALGPLMLPRAVVPDTVPLPTTDLRAFERVVESDRARARRAQTERLPDDVRLLGQAIRDIGAASAADDQGADWPRLRRAIDESLAAVRAKEDGYALVLDLRAVQLELFLRAVRDWERSGQGSRELDELGGAFVRRMRLAGWSEGHTLLLAEPERRVAFKLAWNGLVQLDSVPELQPTLDEMRVLHAFYLRHPHAPDAARAAIDERRRTAKSRKECEALDIGERMAAEAWRLEKIEKLGKIDPAYPADYARGVVLYRLERWDDSAHAFERWIEAHPDGPWDLRARGHLRAALRARWEGS